MSAALIALLATSALIADEVRVNYSNDAVLNLFNMCADVFFLALVSVLWCDGLVSRVTRRSVADPTEHQHMIDIYRWFIIGAIVPLTMLSSFQLGRIQGSYALIGLYCSAIFATVATLCLHRRDILRNHPGFAVLPGFAVTTMGLLAVGLALAVVVAGETKSMAAGNPYCLLAGGLRLESTTDLTPFTFVSPNRYDYHAVLIVEHPSGPAFYNWSWRSLKYFPADQEFVYQRSCSQYGNDMLSVAHL